MNFFDILFLVAFAMFVFKVLHFFLTWLVGLYFLSELYPDDDARNRTETLGTSTITVDAASARTAFDLPQTAST